ncbi:MAG TPA: hypothetical protein VGM23_17565 [Armatimonadota bacterium]
MLTTTSHRLIVTPERWSRLRTLPDTPLLRQASERVGRMAEQFVGDRTLTVDQMGHNWLLIRARLAQTRIVTLLAQYGRTGERRFRDAAMAYVRDMAGWEYWSWIKWREGISDPDAIFDLSYGENACTLALAYDWLAGELSAEERAFFVETASRRAFHPYLARNGTAGEEMWYYRRPDCNWNTVCNGGAGMLALALGDLCPESAQVLTLVEEGIRHYFEFLQEDGAWPEGIGYWGYGHRYGYYYLLSHERATGRTHPLLERPGSRNTLRFPFLFSPNGIPASYGDVNNFFPLPFIFAAAERYDLPEVTAELDRRMTENFQATEASEHWPNTAELLLLHPGAINEPSTYSWPRTSLQRGLEWGYLADAWPAPRLYASVRGGTTDAPHTHQDLTSLTVIVGKERLIENISPDDYIDTTFSDRRFELYEMGAWAKNVMLVNGVGLPHPGAVTAREIAGAGWEGMLLDATQVAKVGSPVHLYGRAVLMLAGKALLVLDRARTEHAALGEVRYHTRARLRRGKRSATLHGTDESLQLCFAANVPIELTSSLGLPTEPGHRPERILRCQTLAKHMDMVIATLLTPNGSGSVVLEGGMLRAKGAGFDVTLRFPESELEVE